METDLTQSENWHGVIRSGSDTADRFVSGRGNLEYRPVGLGAAVLDIPDEAQLRRAAYLTLEMAEQPTENTDFGIYLPCRGRDCGPVANDGEILDYLQTVHQTDLRI